MNEQEVEKVYWGKDLRHEMAPCYSHCGSERSYVCTDSDSCPLFRKWKSKETDAYKKDFYEQTGKKL